MWGGRVRADKSHIGARTAPSPTGRCCGYGAIPADGISGLEIIAMWRYGPAQARLRW